MIKLIASDLDGTLLKYREDSVSQETKNAVLSVLSSGKIFALISGRDVPSLKNLFEFAGDEPYYIGCSGAVCVKDGKVIYSRPIPDEAVIKALHYAKTNEKNAVFSAADVLYITGKNCFQKYISSLYGNGQTVVINTNPDIKKPIYKISFFSVKNDDQINFFDFGVRLSYKNNGWTEYVNRFVNKGGALSSLQSRLGIMKANTASFGDSRDDADMFNLSSIAFSFGIEAKKAFPKAINTESFSEAYKFIESI